MKMRNNIKTTTASVLISAFRAVCLCLLALLSVSAFAQAVLVDEKQAFDNIEVIPNSLVNTDIPLLSLQRESELSNYQAEIVENALSFNLGVQISPIEGLDVRADAWRIELYEAPASVGQTGVDRLSPALGLPPISLDVQGNNGFTLENPFLGNIDSKGFDIGAAYVWDTDKFGQFTLSSKTTYVYDYQNRSNLLGLGLPESFLNDVESAEIRSPDLQTSLMLSWQFGNHRASAITNYFDSLKDLSELNIDEINALVDSITTLDLQYGYSLKTGSNDRAVISFGIRNIFDEKTTQILNSTKRILDQNGRVAYGAIKYQF